LGFEKFLDNIKEEYGRILTWVLGHKRYIFLLSIFLIVGSIALVPGGFVGAAFMQQSDRGELNVSIELAPTASVYQTNQVAQRVEKILLGKKEVTKVFTNVGYSSTGLGTTSNSNIADLTVQLVDKKERTVSSEEFGQNIQKEILQIPGVKVTVAPTSITGNANQAPIQVAVKGTDMAVIRKTAAQVKEIVSSVPGTSNVDYSVDDPKPEVGVTLDREKMAQLGINAAEVGATLQTAFRGDDRSKFKQNGKEYDIMVNLDQFDRSKADDIRHLTFVNSQGQTFELSQFATIREGMGESVLQRIDRLSSITINSQVVGRPSGSIGADIQAQMAKVKLPEGISIEYRGDLKNQADAFGSLGVALLLGIVLIYLIMVALYESTIYPFVVLFSIPVALVGALTALALTMESLTIFSIVGMIMLLGLVAKNAILIVDFANQLKEEGYALKEALIEAGKERLRPILMTTIAMIAGMLPIALASGDGAEVKNGMAWVIIGGLTSSLLLTLFLVPSAYYVVDRIKERFAKRKTRKAEKKMVLEV
jgi:HAE1 family hydrophobic/amphiphilic exporter-1